MRISQLFWTVFFIGSVPLAVCEAQLGATVPARAGGQGPAAEIASWPADPFMTVAQERAILDKLAQPRNGVDFDEEKLKNVLAVLANDFPARIDERALDELGLDADLPITLHIAGTGSAQPVAAADTKPAPAKRSTTQPDRARKSSESNSRDPFDQPSSNSDSDDPFAVPTTQNEPKAEASKLGAVDRAKSMKLTKPVSKTTDRKPKRLTKDATSSASQDQPWFRKSVSLRPGQSLTLCSAVAQNDPTLGKITVGAALAAVCDPLDLTFSINGGCLVVTTREAAENNLQTRIYDITPLIGNPTKPGAPANHGDCHPIPELIQQNVQPDTWESLGGPSTMAVSRIGDRYMLAVSSTTIVQLRIQTFLNRLNGVTQ